MEPIAISGFAFQLPQGAEDDSTLWEILENGRNVMTDWPASRANAEAFHSADDAHINVLRSKGAHFMRDDPGAFDAPFFSITSKEAESMDPQQRLLLETSFRALENAGMPVERVAGTQTGVYSGSMTDDYSRILAKDPDEAPKHTATGSSMSLLANRLSWYFDLKGPSVQVNTACSSSMVAVDLACQSLRSGQSSMALVTGANVILSPESSLYLSNMNFISPDSVSYSFDSRANGYGRGEGVIVLVLKRLSAAIGDGDTIRAVIRATGSNQDGYTPGLTLPSPTSQVELIRSVYKEAGIDFRETRYVEAHGTGTQIGDSTEVKALAQVFRKARSPDEPLYIGSLKANFGHLEGGSGLAGIIKSIAILEKGMIPPNPLFEKWNPKINSRSNNIVVPTACIPWPTDGLRRISVNSFGFGGSNSHVVLDDAYHTLRSLGLNRNHHATITLHQPRLVDDRAQDNANRANSGSRDLTNGSHDDTSLCATSTDPISTHIVSENAVREAPGSGSKYELLVWSAKDENALKRVLERFNQYLAANSPISPLWLERLSYTLAVRRSIMSWRSFAVVASGQVDRTISLAQSGCVRSFQGTGLAFIFTGQGAQYARMGLELLCYPVFYSVLERSEAILSCLGAEWSLFEELEVRQRINNPEISQPLCTVLQIALVELLKSFKVVPSAVVGHSSGEIAAAYTIGALSLESACKVAYHRGRVAARLVSSAHQPGCMISVNLSEGDATSRLEKAALVSDVHIACINSPCNVTLSGNERSIDELQGSLEKDGIFSRKLNTGVAYHSPAMKSVATEYLACVGTLDVGRPGEDNIIMISSVTGERVSQNEVSDGQYWVDNLISPVRFADSLKYLVLASPKADGARRISDYLEVGPHGALRRPACDTLSQVIDKKSFDYIPVLSKADPPTKTVLEVCGRLFARGYPVSIASANRQDAHPLPPLVDLPGYPFNHSRTYWHESRLSRDWRLRGAAPRGLLGVRAVDWNPLEPRWRKMLSIEEMPWIADHVVGDVALFPATATIIMALEAAKQMANTHQTIAGYHIKEAVWMNPIVVRQEAKTEVVTQLRPLQQSFEKTSARADVRIWAVVDGSWNQCFGAIVHTEYDDSLTEVDGGSESRAFMQSLVGEYDRAKSASAKSVDKEAFYKWHHDQGLKYGPAFSRAAGVCWDGHERSIAHIDVASDEMFEGIVHPSVFDASCQVCFTTPSAGMTRPLPTIIPHRIENTWISATGWQHPHTSQIRVLATSKLKTSVAGLECSLTLLADDGSTLCHFKRLEMLPVAGNASFSAKERKLFHWIDWQPQLSLLAPEQLRSYCADDGGEAHEIRTPIGMEEAIISIVKTKIAELTETDWSQAPPLMRDYILWLENHLQQTSGYAGPQAGDEDLTVAMKDLQDDKSPWKLFFEIADSLPSIVRGEIGAVEGFLSKSHAQNFFEELSRDVKKPWLTKLLALSSHQTPNQRILEVGAGMGGMTNHVLSILEQIEERTGGISFSEYVYTDKSTGYLKEASLRFAAHKQRLVFKYLDIEQDITLQGNEPEAYDIIFVSRVLHLSKDIGTTLRNLRRLIKPTGYLVIHEVTIPSSFLVGFGFGILSDWWCGERTLGGRSPAMSMSEWELALRQCGFSGNDLAFEGAGQGITQHHTRIIVSSAREDPRLPLQSSNMLIVVGDDELHNSVASLVSSHLTQSQCYSPKVVSLSQIGLVEVETSDCIIFLGDLGGEVLHQASETVFNLIKTVIHQARSLLWVTACTNTGKSGFTNISPFSGTKDGLLRTLRSEFTNKRIVSLTIEDNLGDNAVHIQEHIMKILETAFGTASTEVEFVVRDGCVLTGRLVEEHSMNEELNSSSVTKTTTGPWLPGPPLKLSIESPGSLESLRLSEDDDFDAELGPTEVEIECKAWGVSFRDVFIALGRLEEDDFGVDCAGIVSRTGASCTLVQPGDRVCMFVAGCMRMWARSDQNAVVKIPDSVSFNEACAVVNPSITAWYSLVQVARLQKGEKVLIHSASGATGQLAVQVAKLIGAEIFATVGYDSKKQLLVDTYGIPEDHIFYSRNLSFAKGVMRLTGGRGVDVVLNSLVGEGLRASWECIAPYGRFVEIGKADIKANSALPMASFAKNASFSAVDLHHILLHRQDIGNKLLHETMKLAASGSIHAPQPLHVYDISSLEEAFRFFQSGRNTGRVIVQIDRSTTVEKHLIRRRTWSFKQDATYIVVGGLGGIGRLILRWMASKGARHLLVPSRGGAASQPAAEILVELTEQGIDIATPKCDVSVTDAFSKVIRDYSKAMPPIRGCINAAMVLQDAVFDNMTHMQWERALHAKVKTSWNLHSLLPDDLNFFILLSSVSGIVGNPGQANYASGCTFQDSLARYRRRNHQHAMSIDLGIVRTAGVVAETDHLSARFRSLQDFPQIEENEIRKVLDMCCDPEQPFSSNDRINITMGMATPADISVNGLEPPEVLQRPLFGHFSQSRGESLIYGAGGHVSDAAVFQQAETPQARIDIVIRALAKKLARALSIQPEDIDSNHPLHAFGVDSLVAVELRNWIAKEFAADLPVFELMGGRSVSGIGELVEAKSNLGKQGARDSN